MSQARFLVTNLFLAQVVHAPGHICSEVEQLLGGQRGGGAVGDGEGRVGLQHAALAQEVQEVAVGGILDGQVQVACGEREKGSPLPGGLKSSKFLRCAMALGSCFRNLSSTTNISSGTNLGTAGTAGREAIPPAVLEECLRDQGAPLPAPPLSHQTQTNMAAS